MSRLRFTAALTGLSVVLGGSALSTVALESAHAASTTPNCDSFTQAVYQRINPKNGVQLITPNKNEYDDSGSKYGYTEDYSVAFKSSTSGAGTSPVYRIVRNSPQDFVWSANSTEIANLLKQGYTKSGGAFLAATSSASCLQPVYTMTRSGMHRQTSDATVMATWKKAGWATQGIAFYAASAKSSSTTTTSTPSSSASAQPTAAPSSAAPTAAPSSAAPSSAAPTAAPSSAAPSAAPSSAAPTAAPSSAAPTTSAGTQGTLPTGPLDLDPTGNTIPDTNYAIPSGAIFISTTGDDANPGTQAAPVKTLNRAFKLAPTKGTIVFRGGVYRDAYDNDPKLAYTISGKGITLQAYPHEKPWLDGSDVVAGSQWTSDGAGHWYTDWSTPEFCGAQYRKAAPNTPQTACTYPDMIKGTSVNPIPADPQQAFINGNQLHQSDKLAGVDANNFYYDWANERMYIGVDPNTNKVELTKRGMAFVLGGPYRNSVLGLGFRRYGSFPYEGINGAVYMGGIGTVQDSVFTQMSGPALFFSLRAEPSAVKHSVFVDNGFTAIGANGTSEKGDVPNDDFVLSDSIFDHNNSEDTGIGCTVSCGQAAIKLVHMRGYTVKGNLVENTGGGAVGIWCDLDCSGGNYVDNVVRNQPLSSGIFVEVGNKEIIANNLIYNNKYGISVASANVKVYNNTLVDNLQGIRVYDDHRSKGQTLNGKVWNDVGPDTSGVEVGNNVVYSTSYSLVAYPMDAGDKAPNTGSESFFSYVDHNVFFQATTGKPIFVSLRTLAGQETPYRKQAEMASVGFEGNSLWQNGFDPFVSRAGADFRIKSDVAAQLSLDSTRGPVPADVATQLGVSGQSTRTMGASIQAGQTSGN